MSLALTGCSLFLPPGVDLGSLTLDVAPRANDDTPIAVDFIAVNDPDLLKQLSGITASQWFAEREQFQRDYRQLMSVWGGWSWFRGNSSTANPSRWRGGAPLDFWSSPAITLPEPTGFGWTISARPG
nr:hypothetical protein GCM10020185_68840 [Pseudomonas brassicacearum subsp. brassicacearum]